MISKLLFAARRLGAGLFATFALLCAGPAAAQTWVSASCSGCHGAPPAIANSVADNSGSFTLGLGEAWMASAATLRTRVQAAGASQGVAAMQNLSATDADAVYAYFLQLRDGAVSSFSASFGDTAVNTTSTDSFSFTISNYRGNAATYTLGTSGTNAGEFAVQSHTVSGAGCSAGNVPATASTSASVCTVNVTLAFTPQAAGTRTATFTVNVSSPSNPQPSDRSIALSGQAYVPTPIFQISTNTLSFSAKVGETTTNQLTISNSSLATANLQISSLSFPAGYSRASGCNVGTSLPAGGSCVLTINFSPSVAGPTNGTLTIGHNAAGSPASVTLNGSGLVPAISSSAASVAFDNSQLGVPKALPAITVTNTGNASLVFTADPNAPAALSGANPGDFDFSGTCSTGAPLAPSASCTLTGVFTPSALGARSATLTIASDASNTPALAITLTGTGVALPEPIVTFPGADFPDTVVGETSALTRQITIKNDRTRNITYSVADTADFKISAESCPTRTVPGGGGNCTITWQFRPTLASGEGRREAAIPISFGGTNGDPAPAAVQGALAGVALLPLNLSAVTLNPAAVVGTPSTVSLLVTNRSASAITLSSIAFSGAAAADYSLDASNGCAAGTALAGGSNCTLVIRFNPPAAGVRDATLTLTHTAPGSPQAVALHGAATPAPQGRIELSATALNFGDVALNASATLSITVHNAGDLALTFAGLNLSGASAADYQRSGSCSTAAPLAIDAQCTLTLTLHPSALGARTASLTIQSDASNGAATITLTGNGVPVPAPVVSLTPATLDFGAQSVGGVYPQRSVRLDNTGNADLSIAAITVLGAGFSTNSTCPATLAPGAGCELMIAFTPTAANADYSGSLRVTSNAAGSPHSAALLGHGSSTALPALVWDPAVSRFDFGNVSAGAVSAAQTATLRNQGPGGAVTLTVLNAVGSNASAFSVAGGTCAVGQVLFEGGTCTVEVVFAPASAGAKSASVQVASTGSFPPTLALVGTGLGGPLPGATLSATELAFTLTRVGAQSLPNELLLSSSGSGSVHVSALAVSGPFVVQSSSCPPVPFTLPAGSSCTLALSFAPTAEGAVSGVLTVTTDASAAPIQVALRGEGEPKADLSGGGCSMIDGDSPTDPTLWALALLAVAALLYRRRARRAR